MAGVNINNEDFIIQNNDKFIIQRELNGKNIIFGTFTSLNEAIIEKDKLDENGWPIPIDETLNIKTQIDTAENQIINNTLEENPKIEEFYENEESEEFIEYDGEYYIIKKYVYNKIKIYGVFKNKSQAINKRNQLIHTDWLGPYAIQTNKYKYGENIIPHDYIFKIEKDINGKTQDFGSYKTFKEAVKARDELIKNKWNINNYKYPPFEIIRIDNFGNMRIKSGKTLKLNINDIIKLNEDYNKGISIESLAKEYNLSKNYIKRIIIRFDAGDFNESTIKHRRNQEFKNYYNSENYLKQIKDILMQKEQQIEQSTLPQNQKDKLKKILEQIRKKEKISCFEICYKFDEEFNKIAKTFEFENPNFKILKFYPKDEQIINEKKLLLEISNLPEDKKLYLNNYINILTQSKPFKSNNFRHFFDVEFNKIVKEYQTEINKLNYNQSSFSEDINKLNKTNHNEDWNKLIFNVKVGKSYKNRGWSVIREETKSLVPLLPYEDSCDIIVDGIPAKAHFNLLPRIFLNNPEDKLRNHLKELHDQNPDDRINVELILNKENINDSNNKDLNHAINEIKRLNNKLEILSKENKKLKKELDKQKSR